MGKPNVKSKSNANADVSLKTRAAAAPLMKDLAAKHRLHYMDLHLVALRLMSLQPTDVVEKVINEAGVPRKAAAACI